MPVSPRITMRDIARKLGIDQSTVSLALRNHPRISEELRQKVRRTANELGYIPDPMLSALAHYRQSLREQPIAAELAWINRWSPPEKLLSYGEFSGYWRGASAAAALNGFKLEAFNVATTSLRRLTGILRARGITGILIPPHGGEPNNDWTGMNFFQFSVVRLGYSVALNAHTVGAEQVGAGIMGFQKIFEKGYRRIGFVTDRAAEVSSRFHAGFLFARESIGGLVHLPALLLENHSDHRDRERLLHWFRQNRPDAIFTTHARVRFLLQEAGLAVPGDVALAGTSIRDGNVDAGIDQRPDEIGRCAVELLISLIHHHHRGVPDEGRTVTVGSRWVDGPGLPNR